MQEICKVSPGEVLVIDAPSGYGKTRALNKLKDKNPDDMEIISYETLVGIICRHIIEKDIEGSLTDYLANEFKQFKILAVEDIDFLSGKNITQQSLCSLFNKITAESTTAVIVTGIKIMQKMPDFVKNLNNARYAKLG